MKAQVFFYLLQNSATTASIYALLAIALVLVFTVTRVIFIPQGEYIVLGAATLSIMRDGAVPATIFLALGGGALAFAMDCIEHLPKGNPQALRRPFLIYIAWLAPLRFLRLSCVARPSPCRCS